MTGLAESYARCRGLNRRHGTTYYWATLVLPATKRPHVHALYGFCRYADDIVDHPGPVAVAERAAALEEFGRRFFDDLARGRSDDPVLAAVVHTVTALDLDPGLFRRFLRSMTMDLDVTGYETWEDLCAYMDGSAAVIGEMMLPILEPSSTRAVGAARDLGMAFQLTNFLRDVGEDLDRGRVYLPREDQARFGADATARTVDDAWVALMRFQIERAQRLYRSADEGLALLPPSSSASIGAARRLYSEILDRIEEAGYDVFTRRIRVPTRRKVAVAAGLAARAGQRVGRGPGRGVRRGGVGRPGA